MPREKKIRLGLLFGGRSCEHEVSVTSARSILHAVDREKYTVSLIGIDKSGRWHLAPADTVDALDAMLEDGAVQETRDGNSNSDGVTFALHHGGNLAAAGTPPVDVMFPALHGTFGEDGTIQGVFEMAGIAFVGCGVAASAVAMDKSLAKKIFHAAGIPQAAHFAFNIDEWNADPEKILAHGAELGFPLFVKPANLGSSVGIRKVKSATELRDAINHALRFDTAGIMEAAMQHCREIECAVLGNVIGSGGGDAPQASAVGEIIPGGEFYDYAAKYIDDTSTLIIPADLPATITARVQELSVAAFTEINAAGLARVDFFVHPDTGTVTLNEINTMPGFTPISMYPKLWAQSGIPYTELIDRLIQLALQSYAAKTQLERALPVRK